MALELNELKKKLRDQKKATDTAESSAKKYRGALESVKQHTQENSSLIAKALSESESSTTSKGKGKTDSPIKTEVNGEKWGGCHGDLRSQLLSCKEYGCEMRGIAMYIGHMNWGGRSLAWMAQDWLICHWSFQ